MVEEWRQGCNRYRSTTTRLLHKCGSEHWIVHMPDGRFYSLNIIENIWSDEYFQVRKRDLYFFLQPKNQRKRCFLWRRYVLHPTQKVSQSVNSVILSRTHCCICRSHLILYAGITTYRNSLQYSPSPGDGIHVTFPFTLRLPRVVLTAKSVVDNYCMSVASSLLTISHQCLPHRHAPSIHPLFL